MPDESSESSNQQQPERQQRSQRDRYRRRYYNRPKPEPNSSQESSAPKDEQSVVTPNNQERLPAQRVELPQEKQGKPHRPQQFQMQRHGHMDVSVVIPLYNEEESLRELHRQLRDTLGRMNIRYELLFIDDGSTDKSFLVLRDLKRFDHHHVKIIRFRRNFGKSAALAVGFEKALGNFVITMDADLQDDPAEIPSLLKKLEEGYDLISGWKKVRRDPITKRLPSKFFNFVTRAMTGIRIHDFNCGLKAYRNDVVKAVEVYGELHRYVPVLVHNGGFRVGEMVVQHRPRKYGQTKFGVGRFWKGFFDLLTILFTTRYFRRPLHLFGVWGGLFALAGLAIDGWLAVEWALGRTALSNRPLLIVGVLLIIVGIQFIGIGLLGEMITKSKQTTEGYAIRDFIK